MISKPLTDDLKNTQVERLNRSPELGVHFSFQTSIPLFEKLFNYLSEIVNTENTLNILTGEEIALVESNIKEFIRLRDQVIAFSPSTGGNVDTYRELQNQIIAIEPEIAKNLRSIYVFLALKSSDITSKLVRLDDALGQIEPAVERIKATKLNIEALPSEVEGRINSIANNTQERLSQFENDQRGILEGVRKDVTAKADGMIRQTQLSLEGLSKLTSELTEEVNVRVEEIMQQARKFSAKEALTTYSQIFLDEAEEVNKPGINRWSWILSILLIIEIVCALGLFFVFLPMAFEVAKDFKSETIQLSIIVGAVLTKIFILSVIAVAINHALKNLNAQRHLYTSNKFKSNSLGSFKAFIDATDSSEMVDKIIEKVANAVYTQNVSGYLSKDDKQLTILDEKQIGFLSKIFGS